MRSAYLDLAERVLEAVGRPMRPAEIIEFAHLNSWMPPHLYGRTPDRTLQARLSEDIAAFRGESAFYRTAPGTFFLRPRAAFKVQNAPLQSEYYAEPRRKELIRNNILSIKLSDFTEIRSDKSSIPLSSFLEKMEDGRYRYRHIDEIVSSDDIAAVNSFVIVHRDQKVLSFRTGKLGPKQDLLYGKRSIGVGGPVIYDDADFLFASLFGIVSNAIRELVARIGLSRREAERVRYGAKLRPWMAIASRGGEGKASAVHLVMAYKCPANFAPTSHSLLVNDLRWLDSRNPGNRLADFDSTTEFLFKERYVRDILFWGGGV